MIEQDLGIYITILLVVVLILISSIFIPFIGFIRKRWKGFAIGCLLQPVVCILASISGIFCISTCSEHHLDLHRKAAMVTVRKVDADGFSHNWYVKADEECLYEYKNDNGDEDKNDRYEHSRREKEQLFDVIPLDSFSVCVDDKVVVRFDMKEHKVTATEYDEPIEVVNIDWDKVSDYFEKRTSQSDSATET